MTNPIAPGDHLSLAQLEPALEGPVQVKINPHVLDKISLSHAFLLAKIEREKNPIYGVNTGFGDLCNTIISPENLTDLQRNLLLSHACGMGDETPPAIVRLMLILKLQNLALGYSGVNPQTAQRLAEFINHDVLPVVYNQGSLGASGDLAPLAHLCLPLIGEGLVRLNGEVIQASELEKRFGWKALQLGPKEGLALINGTQFMSAYAVYNLLIGEKLWHRSHYTAALSGEAYKILDSPFDSKLHQIRPHAGQIKSAALMRELLQPLREGAGQVQDPYSFRCIPQVHGASFDAIAHAKRVVEIEINSVTDNPTVFEDADEVLSGGNFHGQPLALILDFLAIALAELASISERRTYLLLGGKRGLPAFLTGNPGLNSGMMIAQYTAAGIVSQNKQLCTPASVDSIVSSNGQEDHVSMGANAAVKAYQVLHNTASVLGIELLCAAQAYDLQAKAGLALKLDSFYRGFRQKVSFSEQDRFMHPDMDAARDFVLNFKLE